MWILGLKELNEQLSLLEIIICKKEPLKRSHEMQKFTCNKYGYFQPYIRMFRSHRLQYHFATYVTEVLLAFSSCRR